ncbi:rust resistance kinase Lr10 [Trifolium repens]|nr:rust resistance kinase Lr10 [Trifolium repens]
MSLTILALLQLLLMNLGNGQILNNNNSSIECPIRLSCSRYTDSRHKDQILEFRSLPISEKMAVRYINCESQEITLSHQLNCLSSFFLTQCFCILSFPIKISLQQYHFL